MNPGAFEVLGNGVDDDCDPATDDLTPVGCSAAPNFDPTGLTEFLRTMSGFDERSDEDLAEEFDDPQRARRLVLFCTTATNDFFGWDPEDVTDPAGREYGIYLLGRYDTRVTRLATTFREFVLNYCFEGAMKPDGSGLKCPRCKRVYPIEDDIPVMLIDKAVIEE